MKKISFHSILKKVFTLLALVLLVLGAQPVAQAVSPKVVRVGLFEHTYHKVDRDGRLYGYGYEYIQKIASYTGWTIEYVKADWNTCFDKLKNGEIDILNGISYTPERAQDMLFSQLPMAEERYYIYADSRDIRISVSDIQALDGKTVGVMMGAIPERVLSNWEKENHIRTVHTNINGGDTITYNLNHKLMDGFVSVEDTHNISYAAPVYYIGSSDVFYVINQNRPDLKKELDDAMRRINNDTPFYNEKLYNRYFMSPKPSLVSDHETAWLRRHGPIRVGYLVHDGSISEEDEEGNVTGVVRDYVDYATEALHAQMISFELKGYETAEEEIAALAADEIDMIFKVAYNDYYAEQYHMSMTDQAMAIPYVAVTTKSGFDQTGRVRVAVAKDNWLQKWFLDYAYPQWILVEYDSADAAHAAVERGEADCFVTRMARSRPYAKDDRFFVHMLDDDAKIVFGVGREHKTLLSILNKTLKSMPKNLLSSRLSVYDSGKDVITSREYLREHAVPVAAGALAILFVMAIILWALGRSRRAESLLSEQLSIFHNLSGNFKNVYLVNLKDGTARALKYDDEFGTGVSEDLAKKVIPYEPYLNAWIRSAVRADEQEALIHTLSVEHLRDVFRTQNEINGNYRMVVNGREVNYQYMVSKLDKEGYAIAGFQNIEALIQERLEEERKQREKDEAYQKELISAKQEAEKANATKTDFLRRMSHDVRTPINGIRGMVQIAEHHIDNPEKLKECHGKIWKATSQLLSLVNDVLDMNKLESGNFTMKHDPFSLPQILDEVVVVAEAQAKENGIHFDNHEDIRHPYLLGTPVYLQRILMNFAGNAIKYNREGGTIKLTAQEESTDGNIAWFTFTCEDTGIGMSEEFLKKAFEPFTQEEQSEARTKYTGTGLGLAIAKNLVEFMGGTVDLTSTLGEGTKVVVRLPLEIDSEKRDEKEETDYSAVRFDGVRALLAEDNELNAEIATFLLGEHGMTVTHVENGQETVETLRKNPKAFDVVFMDVMMPIMNGLDAATAIRKELHSDIPIFAMTANAFIDDIQRSHDAGMNEHLTKPLSEKEIVKALLKYVGSK